jgi:hypothetical protein
MARLIVTLPEGTEHVFELGTRMVIGRHPACDVQLMDKLVSKEHCVIEARSDEQWIQDLGTLNGTYVNGVRLTEARRLAHLDEISIGSMRVLFSDPGGAMRRSPSANLERPAPPRAEFQTGDLVALRRFYALCRMLSAESDPKQLAADAAHGLFSLCPADWAVLCKRDESGQFVELERAGREKPPENLGPFPALFAVAADSKVSVFQLGQDGVLQLVVPLAHADRVSGVLWVGFAKSVIEIGPVIEVLGTYGSFVAMALKALGNR